MSSKIHFFHANGFPVETYNELLNNLEGQVLPPIRIIGEGLQTVDEGYDNFVDEVASMMAAEPDAGSTSSK